MKIILFAYLVMITSCIYFSPRPFVSGSTKAWVQYQPDANGVYVDVNYADLHLK